MKKTYKIQTLVLMLSLLLLSSFTMAEDYDKTFSKNYKVNADAEVFISNEYGNVTIETWDKNEVDIEVIISVEGGSEKKAMAILDKLDVDLSGSASSVKAVTIIKGKLNCNNCNLSINYEVKMPKTNQLKLKNSFGSVYVGDLTGQTDIDVEYGNIDLGKLAAKENNIKITFGEAEIDFIKAATMHMEYGTLEIGEAGYLDLEVDFTGVEIGEVSELILDGEYEGIEIGSVNMMRAKASFMGIEIGELFDKLDVTSTYAAVEVHRVSGGFSSIDINVEFGGVDLGISSSASYKLLATSSFGDIDFPESRAEIKKYKKESFSTEIEAFIGDDKSSTSTVLVEGNNSGIDIR